MKNRFEKPAGVYSDNGDLIEHEIKHGIPDKPVLVVIPAISVGKPGLNRQHREYLDAGARLYVDLKDRCHAKLFLLGAKHRGDGFLHQIGKDYLIREWGISEQAFAWDDAAYREKGLCSAEEVQLLHQFLTEKTTDHLIVTVLARSQMQRYHLHQRGYGINSVYLVIPDKPAFQHVQQADQEKVLLIITEKDPRWDSPIGKELREAAHWLRDEDYEPPTREQLDALNERVKKYVRS